MTRSPGIIPSVCTAVAVAALLQSVSLRAAEFEQSYDRNAGGWNLPFQQDGDRRGIVYERKEPSGAHYARLEPRLAVTAQQVMTYEAQIFIPSRLEQGSLFLEVLEFNATGQHIGSRRSAGLSETDGWTRLSTTFKIDADAAFVELRLNHRGVGTAWIRQVRLYETSAESFERRLVPAYAGTLEEKKILQDWSLRASGSPMPAVCLSYQDLPPGEGYAVSAAWQNQTFSEGSFALSSVIEDPNWPRTRRPVAKVSFYYRAQSVQGDLNLQLSFPEPDAGWGPARNNWKSPAISLAHQSQWTRVEWTPKDFKVDPGTWGDPSWERISGYLPTLTVSGGKGQAMLQIAGLRVDFADGQSGQAFAAWKEPYWYYPQLTRPNVKPAPAMEHRIMHGSGAYFVETAKGRTYLLEMKKIFPNLGIQSNLGMESILGQRDWFVDHDIAVGFQNISPFLWQAGVARDALSHPAESYQWLEERHHKFDQTSLEWRAIYDEVAKRYSRYGIPEYQIIDGHYATHPSQSDRHFPAILAGEDEGVRMADGRCMTFWDYFRSYTGFVWTPADVGLSSWADYRTTPPSQYATAKADALSCKRGYLDMALRHYVYMRWNANVGEAFDRYGVTYFLMNNGDDWKNGNDWYMDTATAGVRGFVEETFFYHPSTVIKAYPLGPAFRAWYAKNGTHHRLIGETGKGGHGPIYWAPEISYAITYSISAAKSYDSYEVDWPGETHWDEMTDPKNTYHYNRFCDFLAKGLAYNHATLDQNLTQDATVGQMVSLQETPAMYAGRAMTKLGIAAEREGYGITWASHLLADTAVFKNARVLINDHYALPRGMAAKLMQWVDGGNRALVLHGAAAGREIDGTLWSEAFGWDRSSMNKPDQFGSVLGSLQRRVNGGVVVYVPTIKGTVLAENENGPLVYVYERPKGGRVYYYARIPSLKPAQDTAALAAILSAEKIRKMTDSSDNSLTVHPYADAAGNAHLVAFSRQNLDAYKWVYSATDNGVYPYQSPGSRASGTVQVKPGRYRLMETFSGRERDVTVGEDGALSLSLQDINAEVFHLVRADQPKEIEKLRRSRHELYRWLDRRLPSGR